MKKKLLILLSLTMIASLVFTAAAFGRPADVSQVSRDLPPRPMKEVPAEIAAMFEGGMPVEEFLGMINGPVPQALRDFADTQVTVVVEMEGEPLAAIYAAQRQTNLPLSIAEQQAYVASLEAAQATVVSAVEQAGGLVLGQYTRAYNGLLVRVSSADLTALRALPSVVAIRRAPVHKPALSNSVPIIGADEIINNLGYDGTGIKIAIIDTGIDYTHAAFGGSGDPADYASNDPDVVEIGTFPTAKVVGGYDFAGTNYNASDPANNTPVPDDDPLDEHGHGTHVASTAAGFEVPGYISYGVAPGADLYALKVFGVSGSTNLVLNAIEWAMDPDGDADLSDRVDVINMSLGSDFGPNDPSDPELVAANMASAIGIVVVASAGNAGDSSYIVGSPSVADSVISVAASTTGYVSGPTVNVQGTPPITQTNIIYAASDFDSDTGHYTAPVTGTLGYIGALVSEDTLCTTTGLAAGVLTGHVALIQRGVCDFSTKVNNAATLGADAVLIFNSAVGGDGTFTMIGIPVAIPAGFIGHTDGMNLSDAHGDTVVVSAEDDISIVPDPYNPADTAATFTSRGPRGFDSFLKPDVTAPGVQILAAQMGGGSTGVSFSGTSMAAPHVAGAAALLYEANPSWTPAQIKAALMNTAVDLADATSREVPRQGAGRIDALEAISVTTFAYADSDLVTLNLGLMTLNQPALTITSTVTLENQDASAKEYEVTWAFGDGSYMDGFTLNAPVTVTVDASDSVAVEVEIEIDATQVPWDFLQHEEYAGFLTFTNSADSSDELRVPVYGVLQPYNTLEVVSAPTSLITGTVAITHTGPISSSLWVYPLLGVSPEDPIVGDEADLRMLGMDFAGTSSTYGEIFAVATNVYGHWHVPQPYFAEFDLYLDVDSDGSPDFVDFNFNLGWWNGQDDNNVWIVIQVDLATFDVFLGSPFLIFTDFNTGLMEWFLPAEWHGLDPSTGDTAFDYQMVGYDYYGNVDFLEGYFDYAMSPFAWTLSGDPGPAGHTAEVVFEIVDPLGYSAMKPQGLMVVDYTGQAGAGQAYRAGFSLVHFPIINKTTGE